MRRTIPKKGSSPGLFLLFALATGAALLAVWTTILLLGGNLIVDPSSSTIRASFSRQRSQTNGDDSHPAAEPNRESGHYFAHQEMKIISSKNATLQDELLPVPDPGRVDKIFMNNKSEDQSTSTAGHETLFNISTTRKQRLFYTAPICPGCHPAMVGKRSSCGTEIASFLKKKLRRRKSHAAANHSSSQVNQNITLEAIDFVVDKFPRECGFCRPPCKASSSSSSGVYTSFDQGSPTIHKARTHYLNTVPDKFRVRRRPTNDTTTNWTAYVMDPSNQFPNRLHLMDFNPSIVQLPAIYQRDLSAFPNAAYLASYRISSENACFRHHEYIYGGGDWSVVETKLPENNFLGLALVDKDLNIVADGVFSLKMFDSGKEGRCWFGDCSNEAVQERQSKAFRSMVPDLQDSIYTKPQHVDYRLFAVHDQIYLSVQFFLIPLYLSMPNHTDAQNFADHTQTNTTNTNTPFALPQAFPGTAQFQAWMRGMASCAIHGKKYHGSKNLQYFANATNHTVVDIFPDSHPRDIRGINVDVKCGEAPVPDPPMLSEYPQHPMSPSFGTLNELQFPTKKSMFTSDRGSACCVDIQHPQTEEHFLVGISHPKTAFPGNHLPDGVVPNSYFSRFFAMQKHSPYKTVARTGKFCLGYAQESDNSNHPLWNIQNHSETYKPLTWMNDTLDCPRLHFVGSLIDKAGDPSKVIIAYGVSDCLSRFVEMDKAEIANLLWNPVATGDKLMEYKGL